MWSKVAWDDYIWDLHIFCNQIDKQTIHKSALKSKIKTKLKLLPHKKEMKFVKLKLFEMWGLKILKVDKLTIKLKLMTKKVYWQNKNCRQFI